MKKLLTILLAALTLLIISPKLALAANLNVECPKSPSGCNITGDNPLFSKVLDRAWYPGRELTKTINLKNVSLDVRQMGIRGTETSLSNNLDQVMSVSLSDDTNIVIWSGALSDFYNQDGIVMGTFNAGEDKDYYFKVTMDSAANNDYQGLETKFDLTLGFWGDVVNPLSNPGGPGDGLSDGRSSSPSLGNVLTLVTGLGGGQGGAETQGVLGAITKKGEVLGKQAPVKEALGKQVIPYCSTCLWWQIILGEIIVLLIYYWLVFYKKLGQPFAKRKFIWNLSIPIVAYIIFLILNKGCLTNYFLVSSKNIFCQWFWLIDLGIYAVISFYFYRRFKKK